MNHKKALEPHLVNLTDVDKYLTEAEQKPFIGEKDGSRSLKSVQAKE